MRPTRATPTSFPGPLRLSGILGASLLWGLIWAEIAGGALGAPRLFAVPWLALACALTLLVALPIAANRRRIALRLLLALALGVACANWGVGRTDEELIEQGQALVQSIEAYRREHGELPATLDAVGSRTWPSQYGWWSYSADATAQSFQVWLGDYRFDGQVISFESADGEWYVNS